MMKSLVLFLALALLMLHPVQALAQSGGDFTLTWWTVDAGGTVSSGGDYVLNGTIGQADAGESMSSTLRVGGGYWEGGAISGTTRFYIYLPLVLKEA